jgi:histidyl-tRNA synthetase
MFERPRGTNDWAPQDMVKRRYVEASFVRVAESFGFREIQTPIFESLELFAAKSGPGVVAELYAFKDKGDRDLALRPEFTASIVRFYVNELRSLPKPVKVYCYGPAFRYEEPQKGRYREFEQLDAEVIGGATLASDAEVIALAIGTMRAIGLKQVRARIGHIGMLRAYLPFGPMDQATILHALDKKNFPMLDDELGRLQQTPLADPLKRLVALHGDAGILGEARKLLGGKGADAFDYLRGLGEQLTHYGIPPSEYEFDMGVVRGLDYYTGMVFELDSPNLGAEKQVGGGGAYTLAEVFGGEAVGQTGFALGVDRLVLAAEAEGVFGPPPGLDAYVVPIGETSRGKAVEILTSLRAAGLRADIDLVGRGPSKNLDYANTTKARFAVLVGEKELKKGAVGLRDLKAGTQREVLVASLADEVRRSQAVKP